MGNEKTSLKPSLFVPESVGTAADWARRLAFRIRPFSPQALLLVLATLSAATAIRTAFHYFGATLYFTTFFPAVLIAGLFAGLPSGIAVILVTIPLTWWAFLPPGFEFSPLRPVDYVNFGMFVVSAGMILGVTNLYRSALRQLITAESARTLLTDELNHRAGNFLAVMQAIVAGSLGDQQEAANTIVQRINAVARANRMLSDSLPGTITILDILQAELVPFASAERTILHGPEVRLKRGNCPEHCNGFS